MLICFTLCICNTGLSYDSSVLCAGAQAVQQGRLQWSHEGIQAGPELGNGGCDVRTMSLCSAHHHATVFPLLPSRQCPLWEQPSLL